MECFHLLILIHSGGKEAKVSRTDSRQNKRVLAIEMSLAGLFSTKGEGVNLKERKESAVAQGSLQKETELAGGNTLERVQWESNRQWEK